MRLQVGEIRMEDITDNRIIYPLPNKTKKYLAPVLKEYGEEFMSKFNNVFKVAIGIGDIVVENCGFKHEKHIFILIDTIVANTTKFFIDFLVWIRVQPMYENDYIFDDIQKSTRHMIIIKFPEKYYSSFQTFKLGKYSEMFDQETIDKFFEKHPKTKKVFIKDHEYKFYFVGKLNRMYTTNIDARDFDGELDLPPTEKTEVFNHHIKRRK